MTGRKKKPGRKRKVSAPFRPALEMHAADVAAARDLGLGWAWIAERFGALDAGLAGRTAGTWKTTWSRLAERPTEEEKTAARARLKARFFDGGSDLTSFSGMTARTSAPPSAPASARRVETDGARLAPSGGASEDTAEREFARRFLDGTSTEELLPRGSDFVRARILTGSPELARLWERTRTERLGGSTRTFFEALTEAAETAEDPRLRKSAREWTARMTPSGGGRPEMEGWLERMARGVAKRAERRDQ